MTIFKARSRKRTADVFESTNVTNYSRTHTLEGGPIKYGKSEVISRVCAGPWGQSTIIIFKATDRTFIVFDK